MTNIFSIISTKTSHMIKNQHTYKIDSLL